MLLLLVLLSCFSRVRLCTIPQTAAPTRLRRPWDSPGKNTGLGCHFLPQHVIHRSTQMQKKKKKILTDTKGKWIVIKLKKTLTYHSHQWTDFLDRK